MLKDLAENAQSEETFSTVKSLNVPSGPLEHFKAALERLAARLAPVQGLKAVGKAVAWPFKKAEVKEILCTIERQKSLFNLALQNDHVHLSEAIKADVSDLKDDVRAVVDGVAALRIGQRDERRENIRRWLSAPDPSPNHNQACRKRQGTTGSWFVESKQYADWKTNSDSLLWLHGIPGCGKTILSSTIIEDVLRHSQLKSHLAVAYYYFDLNDDEKQGHEKMVRSLLWQISFQSTDAFDVLETLFASCGDGRLQTSHDTFLVSLKKMIQGFEGSFIVLDALDECKERFEPLEDIQAIAAWNLGKLHILATSRRLKDIEESLGTSIDDQEEVYIRKENVCVQSAIVNDDIRAYVHEKLTIDQRLKRWRNQPIVREEIETTLMEKAKGMFRCVVCQLDALYTCLSLSQLRSTLASLPKTLDDTYARILCNMDERYSQDAFKILQWLTYSQRPLRLDEVAELVAVDVEGDPRFDPERRLSESRDVMTICSSLITITKTVKTDWLRRPFEVEEARLAHFSVKEYLVSERIQVGPAKRYSIRDIHANISMAKICLAYLLQFDKHNSLNSQNIQSFPLARYAAHFWTQHARKARMDASLMHLLIMELFLSKTDAYINWIRLFDIDVFNEWEEEPDIARSLNVVASPLCYASLAGLAESARRLLEKGADVNIRGGRFGTALQAAAVRGYDQIVKRLLEKGADVNARGGIYGTALQAAAARGHDQIVQRLLEKGADVDARGGEYGTALQAAVAGGHDQIVRWLLEKGADVKVIRGRYGTALQAAAGGGHDQIVQRLKSAMKPQ